MQAKLDIKAQSEANLAALVRLSAAISEACNEVSRCFSPEPAEKTSEIMKRLRNIFDRIVKPELRNSDADANRKIRLVYGALLSHLEGVYRTWELIDAGGPLENPYLSPSTAAHRLGMRVQEVQLEHLGFAMRIAAFELDINLPNG